MDFGSMLGGGGGGGYGSGNDGGPSSTASPFISQTIQSFGNSKVDATSTARADAAASSQPQSGFGLNSADDTPLFSSNMLLYIGLGLALVGVLWFALKKK